MININRAAAWFQGRVTVTSVEAEGHFSGSKVSFFSCGPSMYLVTCLIWPLGGMFSRPTHGLNTGFENSKLQNFSGSQVNVYLPLISWIVSIKLMRMNRRRSFHFVPAILWNLLYLCWNLLYLWNTLYLWNPCTFGTPVPLEHPALCSLLWKQSQFLLCPLILYTWYFILPLLSHLVANREKTEQGKSVKFTGWRFEKTWIGTFSSLF